MAGLVAALVWLIHSGAFRQFLFDRLAAALRHGQGMSLSLEDWNFSLLRGTIDARNVYLSGQNSSLFSHTEKLHLKVGVTSLLFGDVVVEQASFDGISVTLNYPDHLLKAKPPGPGLTIRFRDLTVRNGSVRIRALEIPLRFDSVRLSFDLHCNKAGAPQDASLDVDGGHLKVLEGLTPLKKLQIRAVFVPEAVELQGLLLDTAVLRWEGTGKIPTAGKGAFSLSGRGVADMSCLRQVVPSLQLNTAGKLSFEAKAEGPWGASPHVEGRVGATNVRLGFVGVKDFECRLASEGGNVSLTGLRLELSSGGLFEGRLLLSLLEQRLHLSSRATAFEAGRFLQLTGWKTPLDGVVSGQLELDLPLRGMPGARFEGRAMRLTVPLPNSTAPFRGESAQGTVSYGKEGFQFQLGSVQGEGVTARAEGSYRDETLKIDRLDVQAGCGNAARDLLDRIVKFHPAFRGKFLATAVNGPIEFHGTVFLKGTFPVVAGSFRGEDVVLEGVPFGTLQGRIDLDPARVRITEGFIGSAQGRTGLAFQLALQPSTRLESAELDTPGMPISRMEKLMSAFGIRPDALDRIKGWDALLRGRISVSLPDNRPWQGSFDLDATNATDGKTRFGTISLAGSMAGRAIRFVRLRYTHARYRIDGAGSWDLATGEVNLTGKTGQFPLDEIPGAANAGLVGSLAGEASLSGTLANPIIAADLHAQEVTFHGEPFGDLKLHGETKGGAVVFTLGTRYRENLYEVNGSVSISANPMLNCRIRLENTTVAPFLRQLAGDALPPVQGEVSGEATLSSPLQDLSALQMQANFRSLSVQSGEVRLTNDGPVRLSLSKGLFKLDKVKLLLNGSPVTVEGDFPVLQSSSMRLLAEGEADTKTLQPLFPDMKVGGRLRFRCTLQGDPRDPVFSGQADLANGSLKLRKPEVMLEGISGHIDLTEKSIRLRDMTFHLPSGDGTLEGECLFDRLKPVRWSFSAHASRLAPRLVNNFYSELALDLRLAGNPASSILSGNITVNRFTPTMEMDVLDIAQTFSSALTASVGNGNSSEALRRIHLDVSVRGDRTLAVSAPNLTLISSADLQIKGDIGTPAVRGNILVSSGEIKFGTNRFTVDRGLLLFNRGSGMDPDVSAQMSADIKDYRVSIILEGPLSKVKARFTSIPALSSSDVLRLIATGSLPTVQDRSLTDTYQSSDSSNLLGQMLSEAVSKRLKRVVGIDTFALGAYSSDPTSAAKAQLTLGKQVTRDLYVTYTKSMTSEDQDLIYMEYRISPTVTVVGTRDEKGYIGLDFRFKKRFR